MSTVFSSDIYEISKAMNELQKQYMPEESDKTRAAGIYGYMNDAQSTQIQNAIVTASEMANEMWPTRAKFERNILSHAIIHNITDINATPARMQIYFGIQEDEFEASMRHDQLIIDRDCPIDVAKMEYHLPYDLVISRNTVLNNEKVYTARYKVDRENELCPEITNPYLPAPFIQVYQTKRFIMVSCMIIQVDFESSTSTRLLSSSPIENKTIDFEFENQLASFVVKVTENGTITYLTPVLEGIGVDQSIKDFCYYIYEDVNSIRVRFDSISYMPSLNAQIDIEVVTTLGEEGNFEYKASQFVSISSNKYEYANITLFMLPASDSDLGRNRKTVEELKRLLPKEALARGSITTMKDLLNYFQMLDNEYGRMQFQKKVDNQFERTYYAYLVLKDAYDNVVPTNTLDLMVMKNGGDFDTHDNRKRSLIPGCAIAYSGEQRYGTIMKRDKVDEFLQASPNNFVYTVPFTVVVTDNPLYVSYYMTVLNYPALLKFTYINELCPLQFIATAVTWRRGFVEDPDTYKLDIPCMQNINADCGAIVLDENGDIKENNLKAVVVFYNNGTYDDGNKAYRYAFAELIDAENSPTQGFSYNFHLEIKTDDKINDDAKLKIFDAYVPGSTSKADGYFSNNVNVKIYILARLKQRKTETEEEHIVTYGRHDLDSIVPEGLEDYTVTNMYDVNNGLDMYINFSDIVRSTVTHTITETKYDTAEAFIIKSVPLVKRSYASKEVNMQAFVHSLNDRKAYLDQGRYLLENNFNIDFKLFNTYGPSRIYSIDDDGKDIVNRINISLKFAIKLVKASDVYTKEYIRRDIKQMIEDLNDMTNLHIPNLITKITNKYYPYDIEYIEFLEFNEYGPGTQHLYRNEYDDVSIVPEFIACDVDDEMNVDIDIRIDT